MQVEQFTLDMMPSLIKLAREVEPLFEGSMAEDKGWHEFVRRKVLQNEALMVRDAEHDNELMGLIAFSHHNNAISWFAVFEKHRGKGVGSKLLAKTLSELNSEIEISVKTFREDNTEGIPARRLYQKYGFRDFDANYIEDGHLGCIMKRPPQPF
jgi:ribosomal protein S18 acetylase RimI-like enzyme